GYAPGIHFHLEAKVDYLDEEMIQMLALIPCSVQVGLQSFHPQVLRAIHRSLDIEYCVAKIQQMAEAG
ncbi:MAG: B12-binding domain-containing radical SAM protein, partial [Nitrospinaceae bacterium]|nr:B12-binding domain-containing radical SAM protein [Nitrospinaceae bacterium]